MLSLTSSKSPASRDDGALPVDDRSSSEKALTVVTTYGSVDPMVDEKKTESMLHRIRRKASSTLMFSSKGTPTKDEDTPAIQTPTFSPVFSPVLFSVPRGLVKASPFTSPLDHKLVARDEPRKPKKVSGTVDVDPSEDSEQVINPICRARRRADTMRRLDGSTLKKTMSEIREEENHIDPELYLSFEKETRLKQAQYQAANQPSSPEPSPNEGAKRSSNRLKGATLPGLTIVQVADHMARQPEDIEAWHSWLECYANGQYTLTKPPPPPGGTPACGFLPAVMPSNETLRLKLSEEFDCLWAMWDKSKFNSIYDAAVAKFGTFGVSLSFFDKSRKLLKAEHGMDNSSVDRATSIAAHVLLTHEVMVIPDTFEDWRFASNPNVAEFPFIRFFAGAPLLSDTGLVVGVFSIFSEKPQQSLSPMNRRWLAEQSADLMMDLGNQLTRLLNDLDPTPAVNTSPMTQFQSSPTSQYHGLDHQASWSAHPQSPPELLGQQSQYSSGSPYDRIGAGGTYLDQHYVSTGSQYETPDPYGEYSNHQTYGGSSSQYQRPEEYLRYEDQTDRQPFQYTQESSRQIESAAQGPYQDSADFSGHSYQTGPTSQLSPYQESQEFPSYQYPVETPNQRSYYHTQRGFLEYQNQVDSPSQLTPRYQTQFSSHVQQSASHGPQEVSGYQNQAVLSAQQTGFYRSQGSPNYPDRASTFEPGLAPQPLRYEMSEALTPTNLFAVKRVVRTSRSIAQTPPPSRDSNTDGENISYIGSDAASMVPDISYQALPSLGYVEEDQMSRPFSSSDLTSIHYQAPNSPDRSLLGDELAYRPSPALLSERLAKSLNSPMHVSASQQSIANIVDADTSSLLAFPVNEALQSDTGSKYTHRASSEAETENILDMISPTWTQSDAGKNARWILEEYADMLGYDIAYICKVTPLRPGMSEDDLLKPRGLTLEVLVKYLKVNEHGNVPSIQLKSANLLRMLRHEKDDEWWSFMSDEEKERHFRHGYLMSIYPDETVPRELRDSGLILGVFAHEKPRQQQKNGVDKAEEVKMLRGMVASLRPFFKHGGADQAEPATPTMPPMSQRPAPGVPNTRQSFESRPYSAHDRLYDTSN